jgi:hypothetical protein
LFIGRVEEMNGVCVWEWGLTFMTIGSDGGSYLSSWGRGKGGAAFMIAAVVMSVHLFLPHSHLSLHGAFVFKKGKKRSLVDD